VIALTTQLAEASRRYDELKLRPMSPANSKLLRLSLTLPAPDDASERAAHQRLPRQWKVNTEKESIVRKVQMQNVFR